MPTNLLKIASGAVQQHEVFDSGADASRPAAGAGRVGASYHATDTLARYVCVSSTTWRCASAGDLPDTTSLEGFTTSAYLDMLGTPPQNPKLADGQTVALCLYVPSLPSAVGNIWVHNSPGAARGWSIYHSAANDLRLYLYGSGGGGAGGDEDRIIWAMSTGFHKIAIAVTDAVPPVIRYSVDGAAAASITLTGFTPDLVQAGDPHRVGVSADGSPTNACAIGVVALKAWDNVQADSDLATISATASNGRLPDGTGGNVVFDFATCRYPRGSACLRTVRGTAAGRLKAASAGDLDWIER